MPSTVSGRLMCLLSCYEEQGGRRIVLKQVWGGQEDVCEKEVLQRVAFWRGGRQGVACVWVEGRNVTCAWWEK